MLTDSAKFLAETYVRKLAIKHILQLTTHDFIFGNIACTTMFVFNIFLIYVAALLAN